MSSNVESVRGSHDASANWLVGLATATGLLSDLKNNQISLIDDDTFLLHPEIQELFLGNNQISRITRLTFAGILNLQKLHLPENLINYISDGAFYRNRLLSEIILSRNQLEVLNANMFAGLQSLSSLWVDNNRLTYVLQNTFKQCPLLRLLILNSNQLSCIESDALNGIPHLVYLDLGENLLSFLPENVFQYTPNLIYLLLNRNNLTEISNRPFRNLHNLVQLAFHYNAISSIAEGAFEGTYSLYYLQWNIEPDFSIDNRLVCDCSSRWLYHFIKQNSIDITIFCSSPPHLRSRNMATLSDGDFDCESLSVTSLQVHADPSCDNHVVSRGSCLHLVCTSTPSSHTTWSRVDNKPITLTPHVCRNYLSCVGNGGERELVIADVSEEHTGTYICTASLMNVTTAVACKVTIGEPPSVLSTPDDQFLAYPGEPAYFQVRVSGQPHPSVEWYHDTLSGASKAVIESKRHMISASGSLVIMDTKLEDQGTYRAIFNNGAGTVSMDALLEFFFASPCRQECQNGGTCYSIHYCYCQQDFRGRHCEIYAGPPTDLPSTDDGSTPETGSTRNDVLTPDYEYTDDGSTSANGSGSRNYRYSDGADFIDDEDFSTRGEKDSGTSARRYRRRDTVTEAIDSLFPFSTSDDVTSPQYFAGERFKSLLWEMSSEERRFDKKLREARELRDRKKEHEIEKQVEEKSEREQDDVGENEEIWTEKHGRREELGGVREADSLVTPENGRLNSEWGEVEWNQDLQRKILLELGLAVEWNEDSSSEQDEGGGNGEYGDAPVRMGLKLLLADALKIKYADANDAINLLDSHTD